MSAQAKPSQDCPPLPADAPAKPVPNCEMSAEVGQGPAARFSLQVIRQHCAECMYAPENVGRCDREECPLWPFQEGAEPAEDQTEARALVAVARFCNVVCCEGDRGQVLRCPAYECALWPWREGHPTVRDGTPVPKPQGAAKAPDMTPVERACLKADQVVERLCPGCGVEPLLPRRRKCDRCRRRARREAWRKEKRRQRDSARIPCPTRDESRRP